MRRRETASERTRKSHEQKKTTSLLVVATLSATRNAAAKGTRSKRRQGTGRRRVVVTPLVPQVRYPPVQSWNPRPAQFGSSHLGKSEGKKERLYRRLKKKQGTSLVSLSSLSLTASRSDAHGQSPHTHAHTHTPAVPRVFSWCTNSRIRTGEGGWWVWKQESDWTTDRETGKGCVVGSNTPTVAMPLRNS